MDIQNEGLTDSKVNIHIFAMTDVGRVRNGNEDNYLIADLTKRDSWTATNGKTFNSAICIEQGEFGSIIAVADGMGGALAGEVASLLAVSIVRDKLLQIQSDPNTVYVSKFEKLRTAIQTANEKIFNESRDNAEYSGMGSTITAAIIDGDVAHVSQVGDSRCYLVRDGNIVQITKDQSLVWQLVERGIMTEDEAEKHMSRNVILQALGVQSNVNPVFDTVTLKQDDILIFCSDGLSSKVKSQEMLEILDDFSDIKLATERFVELANQRGGEDNITVVVAHFEGEGLLHPDDLTTAETKVPEDPDATRKLTDDQNVTVKLSEEQKVTMRFIDDEITVELEELEEIEEIEEVEDDDKTLTPEEFKATRRLDEPEQ